jgi:transposase IS66 family protein
LTAEGAFLLTMLKNFKGVLVSDFYAAYEAIPCLQQKCLIHLIRDLNDDVLKHPYNEELKRLTLAFAPCRSQWWKPVIDTASKVAS